MYFNHELLETFTDVSDAKTRGININLTLTEEQFNTLMTKGFESLPNVVIQDVVLDVIKSSITKTDALSKVFVKTTGNGFCGIIEHSPSDYLQKILKELFETEETRAKLKQIEDDMIAYLVDNKRQLLERAISELICSGVCHSDAFRNAVRNAMRG